jgi:ribosomal protein L21
MTGNPPVHAVRDHTGAAMNKLPIWFLRVSRTERITPHMARVMFTGDDLRGLSLSEPDQQVKLYVPRPGQTRPLLPEAPEGTEVMSWYTAYNAIPEDERPWMRSYTIRWHDPATDTIAIDFLLHKHAGPATRWAMNAKPGDLVGVFGPSEMFGRQVPLSVLIGEADWVLLVGDDAAVEVGRPLVAGARVVAEVVAQEKGDKIIVFRYKRKVRYRRKTGHRQPLTRLLVKEIAR